MSGRFAILISTLALTVPPAWGSAINLGILSFDNLFAGTNAFTVENLTGAPSCGFACPLSDFPVVTALDFVNLTFQFTVGGTSQAQPLSGVGVGSATPSSLEFAASTQIQSVTLTGMLDHGLLVLQDGSSVQATPNLFSVTLFPAGGMYLQAGDLAVISASVSPVPELATWGLLLTGLLAIAAVRRSTR